MASIQYGYRYGPRLPTKARVDSTSAAIAQNDFLVVASAGYFKKAAAGDTIAGVAMQACAVPAVDGDVTIEMDISPLSVYEYPPDAGTVTVAALAMRLCDTGGAASINIDATVVDNIRIIDVDVAANTVFVQIIPTLTGV